MAASLEKTGDGLLTFFCFAASQHKSLRTTNVIEQVNGEFRRQVETQAALPSEKSALLLFFGLFASGQIRMHQIAGWSVLKEVRSLAA